MEPHSVCTSCWWRGWSTPPAAEICSPPAQEEWLEARLQWLLSPGCISVHFFLALLLFVHIRYITHELGPYGSDRLNGSGHYFPPQWWFSFSSTLRLKQSAAHTSLYAPLRRSKFGAETCEKSPFSHFELLLRAQGASLRENVQLLTAAGTLAPSG